MRAGQFHQRSNVLFAIDDACWVAGRADQNGARPTRDRRGEPFRMELKIIVQVHQNGNAAGETDQMFVRHKIGIADQHFVAGIETGHQAKEQPARNAARNQ